MSYDAEPLNEITPTISEIARVKENQPYPQITWQIINRPRTKNGEDFHIVEDVVGPSREKTTVVFTADGAPSDEQIEGEPVSHFEARVFCTELSKQLIRGIPADRALQESEKMITDRYYSDSEAKAFELKHHKPISIFTRGTSKRKIASFAFAGARITYPTDASGNYSVESIVHRDSFVAVLIPTSSAGHKERYQPKVYPLVMNGVNINRDNFPPGTVFLNGSDGSLYYLAQYAKNVCNQQYSVTNDEKYLEMIKGIDDMIWKLEDDSQYIERLFAYLLDATPIENRDEANWTNQFRAGLEDQINKTPKPIDDVTMLVGVLHRREVVANPEGNYSLEEILLEAERGLFEMQVDEGKGEVSGKILGCEFHDLSRLTELLRYIASSTIPSTRIGISLRPDEFFEGDTEAQIVFGMLSRQLEKGEFSLNKTYLDFLQNKLPKYLKAAYIEPIRTLLVPDPDVIQKASRPPEGTLDVLVDKEMAEEQQAYSLAIEMGNYSYDQLQLGVQRWLSMVFGGPAKIQGQIVCLPQPERSDRECPNTEDQFYPVITVNDYIKTSHLEWTNAVVPELTIGEDGGILFPNVLMLPSGPTAVAVGLAYAHKFYGDKLSNITNLNMPKAFFKADRPIQDEKIRDMQQKISSKT